MLVAAPAFAADPPSTAWQGFYLGGHMGGFTGTTTFSDPDNFASIFGGSVNAPGFMAGLQLGYNWLMTPKWLVGAQLDGSLLSGQGHNTCFQSSITIVGSDCKVYPHEIATFTGRLGYLADPAGRMLVYGKGGVAWMRSQVWNNPNSVAGFAGFTLTGDSNVDGEPINRFSSSWGWTIGAGVEYALTPSWSMNVGYDYLRFNAGTVPTPQTIDVTSAGVATQVPGGVSTVTQDMHLARVGLNYHFGAPSAARADQYGVPSSAEAAWTPGWEFEGGARYWYSSGNFTSSNGTVSALVSRLPYNNLEGHSGEVFARLDAPFNVFVKGFIGLGGITNGTMYDEDWALPSALAGEPSGYEITQSSVNGSMSYLTADIGYDVLRGRDHKVGLFVGYNRFQTVLNTQGCEQLVSPGSGICFPTIPNSTNAITETDTWHSLRVGAAAEVEVLDRLKLGVDLAYLPYVRVENLDQHKLRSLNFPANGTGNGVQAEILLSYRVTDSFNVGIGGRYWAMWTTNAWLTDYSSFVSLDTQRYGVFLQASYSFNTP
jgi:opacity protein-like surface antigen